MTPAMSDKPSFKAGVDVFDLSKLCYLDWNSTTPPHPRVTEAMARAATDSWGNPSSVHGVGRRARATVEHTRELLAAHFEVDPRDVVFTSGGTEANNWALWDAPALITSRLEHPSVTRIAERLEGLGRPVHWLGVDARGQIDPEEVIDRVKQHAAPVTVAVMAANHETGVFQPLAPLVERLPSLGARLHVDAVQWLGKAGCRTLAGADSISVSAHKLRGPKGIGALIVRGAPPTPLLLGGAQERGLRGGTQDAVLAAGFAAALERTGESSVCYAALTSLRDRLEHALDSVAARNGSGPRLPHVANLSFLEFPGAEMVAALDLLGVYVSSGSACSAGTSEPSPVIAAMADSDRARRAVRFSLGECTTEEHIEQAIRAVFQVLGGEPSGDGASGREVGAKFDKNLQRRS